MADKASFIIDQHGCAKNTVDAEIIATHLLNAGYKFLTSEDEAENASSLLIIINSCGFIESAKQESIDAVMNARKRYPSAKILLTGCLAERYATELYDSLPEADGIFGNGELSRVCEAVDAVLRGERPIIKPPQKGVCTVERKVQCIAQFTRRGSAYVKLTEGCNNHCSFCAIPLIRGQLRLRAVEEITAEIRHIVSEGIYEVNLIGQDVAAYSSLLRLLGEIKGIEGCFIVRLLYMHPDHLLENDLIYGILNAMQNDSRILPYFDIPFQSGSNRIIRAMNRKGTAEEYIGLIRSIRSSIPIAAIRTTFMAGFPSERGEDTADTIHFIREIRPDWSGCFIYSREEGTAAYNMKGRVKKKIATERMNEITAVQEEITTNALTARLGQEYDVIVEEIIGEIERDADTAAGGQCIAIGRAWFQAPEVDGAFVLQYSSKDGKAVALSEGKIVKGYADRVSGVDIVGHLV